jgi:hypothetical protein
MILSQKEAPNTPNVNAWPDGIAEDKVSRRQKEKDDSENKLDINYGLRERLEFYGFLVIGGLMWYLLVFKLLDWHRFPYHSYTIEVCLIVAIPIILLALLLSLMDKTFHVKND